MNEDEKPETNADPNAGDRTIETNFKTKAEPRKRTLEELGAETDDQVREELPEP